MRFLFKPEQQILWGLHQVHMNDFQKDNGHKDTDINEILDELDEENEVEMSKTMWVVLRKTKPQNPTLKNFFSEPQAHKIKLKDIVKFGRVNFKISAINCPRLRPEVQGGTGNEDQSVKDFDRNMVSQISMLNHTEMNMIDNYQHTNPNNLSTFLHTIPQASPNEYMINRTGAVNGKAAPGGSGSTPIKTKQDKSQKPGNETVEARNEGAEVKS